MREITGSKTEVTVSLLVRLRKILGDIAEKRKPRGRSCLRSHEIGRCYPGVRWARDCAPIVHARLQHAFWERHDCFDPPQPSCLMSKASRWSNVEAKVCGAMTCSRAGLKA